MNRKRLVSTIVCIALLAAALSTLTCVFGEKRKAAYTDFLAGIRWTETSSQSSAALSGGGEIIVQQNVDAAAALNETLASPVFNLPASLRSIEEEAFEGTAIVSVRLPEKVESIGERAFANIPTLWLIRIPDATKTIAGNGFEGSDQVTIVAAPGSYARAYASENGLRYIPSAVMYAGVDEAQVSANANDRRIGMEIDWHDDAEEETASSRWRPVEEIKAEQFREYIANIMIGRAPPVFACVTGMTA